MKKSTKLFSLLLAVMMIFSVCSGVMASEAATGKITIENAVEGATYTVYQILDLESYDAGKEAYAYKAAASWKAFVESEAVKEYLATDEQGYVTWVENADVAAFAELAIAYAKDNKIANQGQATAADGAVVFEGLDLGYYLVDSSLGTICSLDTTNPEVTIKEKNTTTKVVKEVKEDSNNSWAKTNDAEIGQDVEFKATVTVGTNDNTANSKAGAVNYVLHDKMSAGLTFTEVTRIEHISGETTTALTEVADYTVVSSGLEDGCTFEVVFEQSFLDELCKDDKIVVYYGAKVNEEAVVAGDGNSNNIKLVYGEKNEFSSEDGTITYTWDAKIIKFAKVSDVEGAVKEINLAGAIFSLYTDSECKNIMKFHALEEANSYEVCADAECSKDHVTEITTDETGTFSFEGLDSGKYYLKEVKAPAGYNILAGPVEINIKAGSVEETTQQLKDTTLEVKVENKTGTELPSTGGIGTTLFYVFGGLMVAGAAVMLFVRKRMSEEK